MTLGGDPASLAVTPDGKRVYVTDFQSDKVRVIDGAQSGDPTVSATTLTVGSNPYEVAVTSDGEHAYVTNLTSGTVSVISGVQSASPSVTATLNVGKGPAGVVATPDGQHVYVTNAGAGTVSVISGADTARPAVTATLKVGKEPAEVAATPDGQQAYVTNEGSKPGVVRVIDGAQTARPAVSKATLKVGNRPFGVAVDPATRCSSAATSASAAARSASAPAGAAGQCTVCPTPPRMPRAGAGPAAPTDFGHFWYAGAYQSKAAFGAQGTFVVADPKVPASDCHSLAELAVLSNTSLVGFTKQAVEVGWTVSPDQFKGDDPDQPHLFVYHWVNGVPMDYPDPENEHGFVPTSPKIIVGMPLRAGSTLVFKITHSDGKWEIFDGKTEIGYFPGSRWEKNPFDEFHTAAWFGEVNTPPVTTVPCSEMGNGQDPLSGHADEITGMKLRSGKKFANADILLRKSTNPDYYGAVQLHNDNGDNNIVFGGPGGCPAA